MTTQRDQTNTFVTSAWSCTIRLVVERESALVPAGRNLVALLERVDLLASRFRPDSALSRANANAGRPVPIPRLLVDLVAVALDAATQTRGLLDPTVGLRMCELGYDRDILLLHSNTDQPGTQVATVRRRDARRDWRHIRLHRDAGLLTVPAGTALDLGATAKAYIADQAARALSARYETGVLVELGGDLAVAGVRPGGWCISVSERAGDAGQLVRLDHGGIATSTTTIRHWDRDGQRRHHIIDPRTGAPADGPWRTATVFAPTALAANVAATAAIILGQQAERWLTARHLAARLVDQDGRIRGIL